MGWAGSLTTVTPESKCGQPGEGAQAPALCQGTLLERETPSIVTQA